MHDLHPSRDQPDMTVTPKESDSFLLSSESTYVAVIEVKQHNRNKAILRPRKSEYIASLTGTNSENSIMLHLTLFFAAIHVQIQI